MVLGVEELEDLLAHQLVVAVHDDEDLEGLAEVLRRPEDVGHGHHLLLVDYDGQLLLGYLVLPRVLPHPLAGAVGRVVVDEEDAVVGVVLLQHAAEVLEVAVLRDVVEAGDEDADGQFLVLRDVVLLLVVLLLLLRVDRRQALVFDVNELFPQSGMSGLDASYEPGYGPRVYLGLNTLICNFSILIDL